MPATYEKPQHKQAPVLENGEAIFFVDVKLQSLMQFFFDHEVFTFNSCQDNVRGTCWIQYDLESWTEIVDVAFRRESRELFEFIEESCEVLLLSMDDGEPDENDEYWIEGENLMWTASVRFPKKHISNFEKLVREALTAVHTTPGKSS